jgi:CheY-like chemotaxis protein
MAKRLLLVTPAERDRTAFRQFLEASGYEVVESTSGSDAGATAGDFQPDLVLLDHETETDARLALRTALGADHEGRGVPVVELCLTLPTSFETAASIVDRVTTRRRRRREATP